MLYLVATPIGSQKELSLEAVRILQACPLIICESTKEASRLLKSYDITGKRYMILNEHSRPEDLRELLAECAQQDTALVTDCGTPGFSDPGADLVNLCRKEKIPIRSILGASSLMGILSLSSRRLNEFLFRGFLPAETEARRTSWKQLQSEKRALILMDTPYRLKKTLAELAEFFPQRSCLLVMDLSSENEVQLEGLGKDLMSLNPREKAEFMLLLYPH